MGNKNYPPSLYNDIENLNKITENTLFCRRANFNIEFSKRKGNKTNPIQVEFVNYLLLNHIN